MIVHEVLPNGIGLRSLHKCANVTSHTHIRSIGSVRVYSLCCVLWNSLHWGSETNRKYICVYGVRLRLWSQVEAETLHDGCCPHRMLFFGSKELSRLIFGLGCSHRMCFPLFGVKKRAQSKQEQSHPLVELT